MNFLYKILIAFFVCLILVEGRDLPSYFPHCKRFDPKIEECLLKASDTVRPFLKKGVPELKIPSIDPFTIPEVTLEQGTSALNFKAVLNNILIHGLSSYKFSKFEFDVPNLQFFCQAVMGNLNLTGDYKVTGRILVAPIEGNGKFHAKIDQCNITIYQKLKIIQKKGTDYLDTIGFNSSIDASGPQAVLDGLFADNAELNEVTNKIINDNVNVLFEDLKPVIEKVITSISEDLLLKSITSLVPFDLLYPPK